MKKLDEISFTEAQAMSDYASLKMSQLITIGPDGLSPEAKKWQSYRDELEASLETKIRFALSK